MGEEKERAEHTQRGGGGEEEEEEIAIEKTRKGKQKCLDYTRRNLWEKGIPAPRLESSGLGPGHARTERCWENLEARSALVCKLCTLAFCPRV